MSDIAVRIGTESFRAYLHDEEAPKTVEYVLDALPIRARLIHVRWSGEATWIPLGDVRIDVPPENCVCHATPGQVLLYPGGISEAEFLIPYGAAAFASKAGPLVGNHFMTIEDSDNRLRTIGTKILWHGAANIEVTTEAEDGRPTPERP